MASVFLTARWCDLILANYAVDPDLLERRLPDGLDLDLFENRAVCSLVGFMFLDTRVKGIRLPGFVNFPEVNLRFYVREKGTDRRGVVFVRELVTHGFVAWVARTIYNEPYSKARISEMIEASESERRVGYEFSIGSAHGKLAVVADPETRTPGPESSEHWFKEHRWGYGTARNERTLRYEVDHETWECHRVRGAEIDVDWGGLYGDEWAPMRGREPLGVVLATGSGVKVFGATPL